MSARLFLRLAMRLKAFAFGMLSILLSGTGASAEAPCAPGAPCRVTDGYYLAAPAS